MPPINRSRQDLSITTLKSAWEVQEHTVQRPFQHQQTRAAAFLPDGQGRLPVYESREGVDSREEYRRGSKLHGVWWFEKRHQSIDLGEIC